MMNDVCLRITLPALKGGAWTRLKSKYAARVSWGVLFFVIALGRPAAQEQSVTVQKSGLRFSLGVSLGLLYGENNYAIYWDTKNTNRMSELIWDLKPLGFAGVDMDLDWQIPKTRWGIFTGSSFKFGFPAHAGVIEDRDWMGTTGGTAFYNGNHPEWLTHYSASDARVDSALLIDADLGASFRLSPSFLLKAYISYAYMSFSWTATGGSLLYPGFHGYQDSIDVLALRQSWYIISPALALYGKFNRYFDIELSLKASPFVWSNTEDHHLLYTPLFITIINAAGGFFIEPKVVFSYTPRDYFSLALSVSYRYMSTHGDLIQNNNGSFINYGKYGGAGYHAFDAALTAQFNVDVLRVGR
jgi:outer membrane protease